MSAPICYHGYQSGKLYKTEKNPATAPIDKTVSIERVQG